MLGYLIKRKRIQDGISQEALSKGICVPSYLSKIENNRIESSPEILQQLLLRLNLKYIDDPQEIEAFKTMKNTFFEIFHFKHVQVLSEYAEKIVPFIYSSEMIDALIMLNMIDSTDRYYQDLSECLSHFTSLQYSYWCFIHANHLFNYHDKAGAIRFLNQNLMFDVHALHHLILMNFYYQQGDYAHTIQIGEQTYSALAQEGNVYSMLTSSMVIANAYSNLDQLDKMLFYSKRCIYLNNYVKDSNIAYFLEYNLGASYLVLKDYPAAEKHLLLALKQPAIEEDYALCHEKLCFLYYELKDFTKAEKHWNIFSTHPESLNQASSALLHFMLKHPSAFEQSTIIELLKECIMLSEQNHHRGRSLFYVHYLLTAYQKQRSYKKALELMKEFNISS